jgi:uncharacterized cofD-like protein
MSVHPDDPWSEATDPAEHRLSVVALGGGHGLAANLAALRTFCDDLSAVVTVADNGGSSGRIRDQFAVLPPGDLRQALTALCREDEWGRTWATVLQHRFGGSGELRGHNLGNLLIIALWELLGDAVDGLDWVGRLLGAHGRVLPMSAVPLDVVASVRGADPTRPDRVEEVRGQVEVATTRGHVEAVWLSPADPPARPEVLDAVAAADWVVLGPGSWYTSVLPHLLVPDLLASLSSTAARRCVTLNIAPQLGETEGFSSTTYLEVLMVHAPDLQVDVVLADRSGVSDMPMLEETVSGMGAELVLDDLCVTDGSPNHDIGRLARAYRGIMS